MINKFAAAALAIGLCAPASALATSPDLTGDWVGLVSEAVPFPLTLHVRNEVRLDSPDRGIFGMLGEARQSGSHVNIVFANGAAFEGVLKGDRLAGHYLRGPAALPLAFQRKRSWLGLRWDSLR
ncbi:MAG: hypothetical protein ACJ798_00970 [Phenylobacterium sp.]